MGLCPPEDDVHDCASLYWAERANNSSSLGGKVGNSVMGSLAACGESGACQLVLGVASAGASEVAGLLEAAPKAAGLLEAAPKAAGLLTATAESAEGSGGVIGRAFRVATSTIGQGAIGVGQGLLSGPDNPLPIATTKAQEWGQILGSILGVVVPK